MRVTKQYFWSETLDRTVGRRSTRLWGECLEDRLNPAPALTNSFATINLSEELGVEGQVTNTPDVHGAAGPNHVVQVVNQAIAWYTKTGTRQSLQRLSPTSGGSVSFFSSLTPTNIVFDPKVVYDPFAGRFVVVALERDAVSVSRILVAVSKTSEPNQGWWFQAINSVTNINGQNTWADFPGLGVDEEAVYITNNMFTFNPRAFQGVRLWTLNKGLYNGNNGSVVTLRDPYAGTGLSATTTTPASVYGTPPVGATGTYLASYSANPAGVDVVRILRVDNPLGAATITATSVTSLGDFDTADGNNVDVPQRGTSKTIEAGDGRFHSAVWRNGRLTLAHSAKPPSGTDAGQMTAHWVQVDTASFVATGGFVGGEDLAAQTHTFYPALAVDDYGRIGLGFSASGTNLYAGAYYTVITSPSSGFAQSTGTLAAGQAAYELVANGDSRNRWGDYSAVSVDPDGRSFWAFNQFAAPTSTSPVPGHTGTGRWGTRAGRFAGNIKLLSAGAGAGGGGSVNLLNLDGTSRAQVQGIPGFTGEVLTATGDVNGDGVDDLIAGAGNGGSPRVRVLSGANPGTVLHDFFAYESTFTGGVFVAAGDVDGNGKADLITGTGVGGGPRVVVFRGEDRAVLADFFAYESTFRGGVFVGAGDTTKDNKAEVIAGTGNGGGPRVKVLTVETVNKQTTLADFFGYPDANFRGGIRVAGGDVNADGYADVIAGPGPGVSTRAAVYNVRTSGTNPPLLVTHFPYPTSNGVTVAAEDVDTDGYADVVTGPGAGTGPRVKVFGGKSNSLIGEFDAFAAAFTGGLYVG